MSALDETESIEETLLDGGFDPRPKSRRPFKDESDVEDDVRQHLRRRSVLNQRICK